LSGQGLLLPAFKYADKVAFLDTDDHRQKYNEPKTILQHALDVDNNWVLDRPDCESVCLNYQIVVELTQK
jgi:hypothetical protein